MHDVEAERARPFMMIFFIFCVIFIQSSSVEAVMPEYLQVNRAVSRNDAIENYFTIGFTGSEILSFLERKSKDRPTRTPNVVFVVATRYQSLQIIVLFLQACRLEIYLFCTI